MSDPKYVRYSKEHHEQAKTGSHYLFTLDINGIPGKRGGQFTYQGCLFSPEEKKILDDAMLALLNVKKSKPGSKKARK